MTDLDPGNPMKLPWSVQDVKSHYQGSHIVDSRGVAVCEMWQRGDGWAAERREFILQAVNSYHANQTRIAELEAEVQALKNRKTSREIMEDAARCG